MKNKTLSLLFLLIAFVSCQSNKQISRTVSGDTKVFFLDFRPFLEKGFVFSTGDINQKYIPVGLLSQLTAPDIIKIYTPSYSAIPIDPKEFEKGTAISENNVSYTLSKIIPVQNSDIDTLLQTVYDYAISKGANGMINMKYDKNEKEELEISGTLIKIEK